MTDDTPERTVVTLTVPEGYTLPRIGMTLEDMGVCTAEAFIDAAQNGDFSMYSLVAAQKEDPDRCFKLEGYLFPATYEMYSDEPPETIIHRMLSHLEKTVSAEIRDMVDASGYTFDEVLTLASIIEKEAFGYQYMPDISSVLHNRLDTGMRLQCDVTINYVEGAIKPFITGDTERYNEHYNTYKCAGIPSGAICNPGLDAILAAVSPGETDYLYFVTDKDKNYHFSATWEDHEANVAAIKAQTPASSAA
ncbi:MAG: endolytic transglycosylase MltG [Oscillospiraceae bacterium]|nr:endolytic transglycosylase MltG [Oscillospiraceae bacterium]